MSKIKDKLIFKLLISVVLGMIIGQFSSTKNIILLETIKYILGQIIFFTIPLIILGFIAPAIAKLKNNAGKMLIAMLSLSYLSSIGAAFFSMILGYSIIPYLSINSSVKGLKTLPEVFFKLDIPPIMPVMSALILAIFIGLAVVWTNSEIFTNILLDFNKIVLALVNRIVIPILPIFIFCTFAGLAYEGSITKQLPVFIKIIGIIIICHFVWLSVLYAIGAIVSKKNPFDIIRNYIPAYLTAVGTMSSAATLPVALKCAKNTKVLKKDIIDFAIPLGSTTHLCGSVLTEVFFLMTVSRILYSKLPSLPTMIIFIILLGIFAVGAPGVPGGTVLASLGIIVSVLKFNDTGIALMLTIFALQDSFGTACNITGDGALALILQGIFENNYKVSN
ncbi:dicarboxylate/amino acid:cation symporter [Sneathia sp. DSM 16631]|nr:MULTISPECIES: dicarboxylate/amino acid:cation symporter [Sneathia]MBE3030390.1 dicarboxylate/amino acid:cation symporter [Sneathia sp. DSM 16631]MDK9581805.1 dicarboxylate/amino acid:cation symporter [Sneathia vaginalis]